METFRLIHLSDLHFDTGTRGHSPSLVEDVAEWVYNRCQDADAPVDAIVITGDLADYGGRDALELAHRFVHSPPAPASDPFGAPYVNADYEATLAANGLPIFLLPGNHDRWDRRKQWGWVGAGNTTFDQVFHSDWPSGHNGVYPFPPLQRGQEQLQVIGADACLPGTEYASPLRNPGSVMGQGYAPQPTIDRLVAASAVARHRGRAFLWAIHFPPFFYPYDWRVWKIALRLRREKQVAHAATAADVPLMLTGHTHEQRHYQVKNTATSPWVQCAGCCGKPTGDVNTSVHIVELDVEVGQVIGQARVRNWRYDGSEFNEDDPGPL
ncbi:MAG: metallophosphoesterase [Planctomycetota bacterium]